MANISDNYRVDITVTEKDTALAHGSGGLEVLATPAMIALMENAAFSLLKSEGADSVGTEMNVKHISATPQGMRVCAEAVLTSVNGRELTFSVKASDESGLIGEGEHKRFLVYGEKFTAKTQAKLQ